ncbi:MAG: D-glycerate dehydrogenase [Patescibacteria group bacterium]
MPKIFVTRKIPEAGIKKLLDKGYEVEISKKNGVLSKEELIWALREKEYDAVLCLLTDTIDGDVFDAAPKAKIFANYAVGFNNIALEEAKKRGLMISNTPGVLTGTVAEHTFAMMMAIACRLVEGDRMMREGKFIGWEPELLLGTDLSGKTLGILGAGRIGGEVVRHAALGFNMKVLYYDVSQNTELEEKYGAVFCQTPEELLKESDFVSIHVPLLPSTKHLINKERLGMMKNTAYLVNTSRGPVIDENALAEALKNGVIKGAALDVFENEPMLTEGIVDLPNILLTPHIASATEETRSKMSEMAAENIIEALEGRTPPNLVK